MRNKEISEIFNEIAEMVRLDGKPNSRFEARAFQNAAVMLENLQEDVGEIYKKGGREALMELPGIGKGLAERIAEYVETGRMKKYDELKRRYPIDFTGLSRIEGLGPKKIVALYRALGIKDMDGLRAALSKKRIRGVVGFGERSEDTIRKGMEILESSKGRILLGEALPAAEEIARELMGSGLVERVEIAGSIRRMRETVGDIDILAISGKGMEVMELFTGLEGVVGIVSKGPSKTTVRLGMGVTCDLRVIDATTKNFGAALQYFTGSKEHSINLREIAIGKGYKLNEYGLFDKRGRLARCKDEEELYGRLGMQYIPPEMRENRGEIAAARKGAIPKLVELGEIRGDMHTHTKETDGSESAEEMAAAAAAAGLEYIAITNHTKSLKIANGMDDAAFRRFFKKIDALNERREGAFILKGAEVDILKDGSLDLSKSTLKGMGCVVASVHSYFNMDSRAMTERVVKAIESGMVNIIAHPTGRMIGERKGYEIDLDKVAEAAEANGTALEINSSPNRLDLNDSAILQLSGYKVMFSIDSDAHNRQHFGLLRYGVGTARRGWLTKEKVLNALPLKKVLGKLRR